MRWPGPGPRRLARVVEAVRAPPLGALARLPRSHSLRVFRAVCRQGVPMDTTRLEGKVLMVTGATRGIGLATAERLSAEGARLVLTARGEEDGRAVETGLRASGADAVFVAADMTDVDGPLRIVETAVARYGRLDGALNNV